MAQSAILETKTPTTETYANNSFPQWTIRMSKWSNTPTRTYLCPWLIEARNLLTRPIARAESSSQRDKKPACACCGMSSEQLRSSIAAL